MKRGLDLDKVVLLGRTFDEYVRFFALNVRGLKGKKVLDVAAGVSSFCAEANGRGMEVKALDLIYDRPAREIKERCVRDLEHIVQAIANLKVYRWDFYENPDGLRRFRERAYQRFLRDYVRARSRRYVVGILPRLPFRDREFDVTLVSYLLFVYQDQFDYAFHKDTIQEIMRVTSGEARLYPLVTFEAERSKFVDRLKADVDLQQLWFEEFRTEFEFLANSNSFLRIRRKSKLVGRRLAAEGVGRNKVPR